MVALAAARIVAVVQQWVCPCCGFRLGDITATGVRVVVPHWRREGARLVVRCPHCRRRATLGRTDVAG